MSRAFSSPAIAPVELHRQTSPHFNDASTLPPLKKWRAAADMDGMKITIHRDDVSYGPYTLDQVKALISQHRFAHGDLACVAGEAKWVPLEELVKHEPSRSERSNDRRERNAAPKKDGGKKGKHANRWEWKPE